MNNEQIETIINRRKRLTQAQLEARCHRLKDWLEEHFESGRFFTIEEICNAGLGYELNTNPHTHDKCIALSNDVKQLNWHAGTQRYIPIIKDKKGSIKLCENEDELKGFVKELKGKVENANKYANHLQGIIDLQDTIPFVNQANRVLDESEMKPIEVYAK